MVQTLDGVRTHLKKILYISYDGMTDPLGQSQVIPYLKELVKDGYRVTLLSVEKKDRLEKNGQQIRSLLEASGIKWETLIFTTQPPLLSKLIDQRKLNRKAKQLHRENNFDMVHCRSYVAAEAGSKLAKTTGIPFLFDMRGFWVDERVDSGLWNLKNPLFKFFYTIYKKKEKRYFAASSHIISLTEKGKQELMNTYKVPAAKITVIPCCADLAHFDYRRLSSGEMENIKKRSDIPAGARVLSYLGSLGGWYMTGEMLEFFKILQQKIPSAIFLIITHDNKEQLLQKVEAKGIDKEVVRVIPAGRNEVPGLLSVSDWNIFFIKDAYSKKASSPTKQGEVMAMGIPVICNDIGDTGKIVEESAAGILVKSFQQKELEAACHRLLNFQPNKAAIREAAFKYYDLARGAALYKKIYEDLLN
ncbi:MAG TPA: glycosyltransferase [Chitinophagaceae bacterium]|nr:glycosyltransferase [Chitinophagaceae bacterium]